MEPTSNENKNIVFPNPFAEPLSIPAFRKNTFQISDWDSQLNSSGPNSQTKEFEEVEEEVILVGTSRNSKPYRYLPDVFSHKCSVAREESISPQFSEFDTNSYPSSPSINAIKDDYLSSSDSIISLVFEPKIEISTTPSPPKYIDLTQDNEEPYIIDLTQDKEKLDIIDLTQDNEEPSKIHNNVTKTLAYNDHEDVASSSDFSDSTIESEKSSNDFSDNEKNEESVDDSDSEMSDLNDLNNEDSDIVDIDDDDIDMMDNRSIIPLRTKNEVIDILIPKPEIELRPDIELIEIGNILHVVENQVVVQSNKSGEALVLDFGTILLLQGPNILGVIFETIGPVHQPLYVIRFNDSSEINKEIMVKDAKVFSSPDLIKYTLTPMIREVKGCDASNIYDEEVSDGELEFSDDEKEQQHKQQLKRQRTRNYHNEQGPFMNPPSSDLIQLTTNETNGSMAINAMPFNDKQMYDQISGITQSTQSISNNIPQVFGGGGGSRGKKRKRGNPGGRGGNRFITRQIPTNNNDPFVADNSSTFEFCKLDSLSQLDKIERENSLTIKNEPFRPTCLACGNLSFADVEQQRAHYKLDWHRFNVKRRAVGLSLGSTNHVPVSEQEFEELMGGESLSSISGSETLCSDSSSQEDSTNEFLNDDINDINEIVEVEKRNSQPILWFTSSNILEDKIYLGVYKNILHNRGGEGSPLNDIKNLINPEDYKPKYWSMFIMGGGHFAGLILDIVQNLEVTNPKEIKVIVHKTFHRYTTRRKQGGSQTNSDKAKGKSKSAGASLRRYNEDALRDDIRSLLHQWKSMIDQSKLVFIHAPSYNKKMIYNYDGAVLKKDDPRIRSFPFSTRRATFNELKRCFIEFTTVKVLRKSGETLQNEDLQCESVQRSIKDKPPLDQGKLDLMKQHIFKHSLNILDPLPDIFVTENVKKQTLLHISSLLGHYSVTEYLLEQGADPTIVTSKNFTPYDVAKDKETRNIFRRYFAEHPDQWDWKSAHVPKNNTESKDKSVESKKNKSNVIIKNTDDIFLGISPEMRMRIEREKRARAAEARFGTTSRISSSNVCTICGKSLSGLTPFEIMQFKFCSTICVGKYRELHD
ncbi:8732_t:CDS:10 [Diversispora eburnea]|uniref:8732_t:CDS:1 n=1 Tax=Diversispora eburnea TaxID=1213867 RepID=A0A9N9G9S1_9GLOM|nr:8732_t:CDS:10 [Diversispora eburnea]